MLLLMLKVIRLAAALNSELCHGWQPAGGVLRDIAETGLERICSTCQQLAD